MKMPDGDAAIVDRQKLTGYCLNPEHPRGKHKARVFAMLGFTAPTYAARELLWNVANRIDQRLGSASRPRSHRSSGPASHPIVARRLLPPQDEI